MTRIVEDSDDDLPELADLLKYSTSMKRQPSGKGKLIKEEGDVEERQATGKAGVRRTKERNRESDEMDGAGKEAEMVKPRRKKRVLNQASDNPLLRPISTGSASSELVGKTARSKVERSKGVDVGRSFSRDVLVVSRIKSRCVTPAEESAFPEEKDAGKSRLWRAEPKRHKEHQLNLGSEGEEEHGSDGLSDFIVNNSSFLEEEDSVIDVPPPRSTRKLVQGRRQRKDEEVEDDGLDLELQRLSIKDSVPTRGSRHVSEEKELKAFTEGYSDDEVPAKKAVQKKLFKDVRIEPPRRNKAPSPVKNYEALSSDEDLFTLRYSPSESKPKKVFKETRFATPPGSPEPKNRGLASPKKRFQRIPSTPHRQSMDTFWQQDVINDWNDEYSPQKTPKAPPKLKTQEGDDVSECGLLPSPKKSPMKQDQAGKEAKKVFSQRKHEIAEAFLVELDDKITNGQVSKLAVSTGGVKIIWSRKLNTTAGRANWKRETVKSSLRLEDGKPVPSTFRHHASIELAEKVIDDEDRLLNVIAHEFCHLANFMVSNIKTNPHGKEFKAWAAKCSRHFGDRGIEVTTKHSYKIDYKYVWECENCGIEFKRHSKSIDPSRHQCGSCKSKLVQIKPAPRAGAGTGKVSEYQMFVKENMKRFRDENPGSPQKEIMGLVGKNYQEYKASKLGGNKPVETVTIDECVGEKEGTPDDEIGSVARKLDFLDLTTP